MGGPLVLATLAYAVVGIALWRARRGGQPEKANCINADQRRLARDQAWFMGIFVFKVGLGLLAFAWKPWLGILFLATYGMYVKRELSHDEERADSKTSNRSSCGPATPTRRCSGRRCKPCWRWW